MALPSWPVAWQELFAPLIDQAATAAGLPRDLAFGLVAQESSFNSGAYRAEPGIGDASYGLTQILYRTAQAEGYTGSPNGLFDPEVNLRFGFKYLRQMLTRFGREKGIAAYNGGLVAGTIRNPGYVAGVEAKASYFRGVWGQPGATPAIPRGSVEVAESASLPAWLVLGLLAAAVVRVVRK